MRLRPIALGIAILAASAGAARADFLAGGQLGAGPLRLNELEDFWDAAGIHYDTDPLAFYWELSTTWRIAPRHSLRVSVERITTSVVLTFLGRGFEVLYSEQDFTTVPICLGYEFSLARSQRGASTYVGIGAGYYLTEFEGSVVNYFDDPSFGDISYHSSREGEGYGFHGYLRQTAPITERWSLSGMIRGRWADGTAFEDDDAIPVEFTGLDVSIGLEWRI